MKIILITLILVFVLFLIIAISISSTSFQKFTHIFNQYNDKVNSSYISAKDFATLVNQKKFNGAIRLSLKEGEYSDSYDYANNVLYLSQNSINNNSISSLCVVAHELGHAVQKQKNSSKFQKMAKIRKFVTIGCKLITPLIIVGIILLFFEDPLINYVGIGCGAFGVFLFFMLLLFKIRLLRVEKEASKLGILLLKEFDIFDEQELKWAKEVLDAAYMTYVGDFFRALLSWTMLTKKSARP